MTEPSEGIAHGKMPSEVILEIESGDGPFARTLLLRIVRFEACIETKQEEVDVSLDVLGVGDTLYDQVEQIYRDTEDQCK